MEDLKELRKTAEAATQGNWMWVNDRDDERIRAGKFPYHHVTYTDDVVDENALYIATFDPPTVLALLSRLEQAEQAVQRVREVAESSDDKHLTMAILEALDGDTRRLADDALTARTTKNGDA